MSQCKTDQVRSEAIRLERLLSDPKNPDYRKAIPIPCRACGGTGELERPHGGDCYYCGGAGKVTMQGGRHYRFDRVCGKPMYSDFAHQKQDRICNMHSGHPGRHCSVAWYCDGCGKGQRGRPFAYGRDGEYERGLAFCFMCAAPKFQDIFDPQF